MLYSTYNYDEEIDYAHTQTTLIPHFTDLHLNLALVVDPRCHFRDSMRMGRRRRWHFRVISCISLAPPLIRPSATCLTHRPLGHRLFALASSPYPQVATELAMSSEFRL